MDSVWAQIALVLGLIVVNGAFAGSEIALVSLRESQLAPLERRGAAGRAAARLVRAPNRFLATIQIGITVAGFLASAIAAVTLARPVASALASLGNAAEPVAVVIVTTVLAFVTLVLGELAPKRIALQRSEAWSVTAAPALEVLSRVTAPLVWLLSVATDLVVRLLGGDPEVAREDLSVEEVQHLLSTHRALTPLQRTIVSGTLGSATLTVRDVMVPRTRVTALPADLSVEAGLQELLRSGRSRAPVFVGSLDHTVGVVHIRDLMAASGTIRDRAAPVLALPDHLGVLDALRRMQRDRQHLAILVDEHGGVDGIVTLEDLIEELVGEIYDESDRVARLVEAMPDGSLLAAGSTAIHDLTDWGVELPEGDYSTIGGLVLDSLGRLARPSDAVTAGRWRVEVLEVDRTAVRSVRISPVGDTHEDGTAGAPGS